jgi:ATP-dependent DNA ligase
MLLRSVCPRPNGFIEPCLPSPAAKPPAGAGWLDEIKHDRFRLMALKAPVSDKTRGDAIGVRLFTRRGLDWTDRYPSIAAAVAALSCCSCLIDGEVVICGEDGILVFDRLRYGRQPQTEARLFAFDLLELGGKDMRRDPLEKRKSELAKLPRKASWAVHFNEHIAEPGDVVFRHACKLGLEGIVSKRLGSPYRSGRSRHWVKSKNAAAPAVVSSTEKELRLTGGSKQLFRRSTTIAAKCRCFMKHDGGRCLTADNHRADNSDHRDRAAADARARAAIPAITATACQLKNPKNGHSS